MKLVTQLLYIPTGIEIEGNIPQSALGTLGSITDDMHLARGLSLEECQKSRQKHQSQEIPITYSPSLSEKEELVRQWEDTLGALERTLTNAHTSRAVDTRRSGGTSRTRSASARHTTSFSTTTPTSSSNSSTPSTQTDDDILIRFYKRIKHFLLKILTVFTRK